MSRHDDIFLITIGSNGAIQRDLRGQAQLDLFDALYEHVPERSQRLAEGHGWPASRGSALLRELERDPDLDDGVRTVSRSPRRKRRRAG